MSSSWSAKAGGFDREVVFTNFMSLLLRFPLFSWFPQKSGSFARGRCRRGRSEIPHFCSKLLLFALVRYEKQRECVEKGEKCVEKGQKMRKKIRTNPTKNLPQKKIGMRILFSKGSFANFHLVIVVVYVVPVKERTTPFLNNLFSPLRVCAFSASKMMQYV